MDSNDDVSIQTLDEVIYDNSLEDKIEDETLLESAETTIDNNEIELKDEEINDETTVEISENSEKENIYNNQVEIEEVQIDNVDEPKNTITNDVENFFTHSSFHKDNILEIPEAMSRRRRIALKLTSFTKDE